VGEASRAICDARSIAYPDGGAKPVAMGKEETAEAEDITSENGEMAEGDELKKTETEEIVMEEEATLSKDGEAQDSETEEIEEEKETEKSNDN